MNNSQLENEVQTLKRTNTYQIAIIKSDKYVL